MDSGSSPTTTTTTAAAETAAEDVLNLIMKPHLELMQPQHQQQQQQQQTQKMRKCALRLKTKNLQQKQPKKNPTTINYNNNNNNNNSSHRNFNKISSSKVGSFLMPKTTTTIKATTTATKTITAATKAAKRAAKLAAKALATTTTTTTAKRPIRSTIKNTATFLPTTTSTTTSSTTSNTTSSNSTTKQSPTTTTKEKFLLTLDLLAVVRRNASDKLKLIQMVHDNPILWDSRLPNFKGAEEEKTRAWEHIGKEFNAPGRRVARAFKSLRESYRRELAHVKVMGSGFKPKWSLYEAMDFLRDVIRERKGGSHMVDHSSASAGLNLTALSHHNAALTQHSNSNNNNNNNNHHHHHPHHHNNNNSLAALAHNSLHSSFNDAALNLSSRSSLNLSQDNYNYLVKRELDLSSSAGLAQQLHAANAAHSGIPTTHHHQQHHDTRVSSTRNDTAHNNNSNNNANFDDTMDGAGSSSPRSADEASVRNTGALSCSDEVEELDAIDADFPYPLILDNSTTPPGGVGAAGIGGVGGSNGLKRRRKDINDGLDADDDDDGDEEDTYGGQMLQQHRHLRQQNGLDMPPPQTVREVLNSKFCGFISAKLNSMEDTEADNLMNKILMLLVQTQGNVMLLQEANK